MRMKVVHGIRDQGSVLNILHVCEMACVRRRVGNSPSPVSFNVKVHQKICLPLFFLRVAVCMC